MSRRRRAEKRQVLPDPKFGDLVVTKFMNMVMYEGKKAVAENILYGAFDILEAKRKDLGPLETFHTALENVKHHDASVSYLIWLVVLSSGLNSLKRLAGSRASPS